MALNLLSIKTGHAHFPIQAINLLADMSLLIIQLFIPIRQKSETQAGCWGKLGINLDQEAPNASCNITPQTNRYIYQHARRNLRVEPLTPREREVLQLVAVGLSTREIVDALIIAGSTVKRHVATIFSKLGANRRTQAVAMAREPTLL